MHTLGLRSEQSIFLPGLYAKHNHLKGLKAVLYLHKWLLPGVNQDVAAQMVVPDKGFATPFMVTNERSLAGRKEKKHVNPALGSHSGII